MTDQELLKAAAEAAGIEIWFSREWHDKGSCRTGEPRNPKSWNPLTDDGDALRLAVKLKICVEFSYCLDDAPVVLCGDIYERDKWEMRNNFPCPYESTRRAIVRAAAEIGGRNADR